jgi:hypothetical protein
MQPSHSSTDGATQVLQAVRNGAEEMRPKCRKLDGDCFAYGAKDPYAAMPIELPVADFLSFDSVLTLLCVELQKTALPECSG